MLQAFYTGDSGLNANKEWLSTISDNVANVNTVGYKQERTTFQDLVSSSLTTYSASGIPKNKEIGGGSYIASTVKDFSQGEFKTTNSPFSLALDGEGFFMVKNPMAKLNFYTRNGDFRIDANGDVINQNGYKLQGWTLDDNGNMAGAIGSINIDRSIKPKATSQITFEDPTNLNANVDTINKTFDENDSTTYNYVNSMTVYDSLGSPHTLTNYFVKTDANKWKVYTRIDNADSSTVTYKKADGTSGGEYIELDFNSSDGSLNSVKDDGGNAYSDNNPQTDDIKFTTTTGANTLNIKNNPIKITQVSSDFIFYAQQNGSSKGDLMSTSVTEDGVIKATYTNGQVKDVARLAVATFKDKEMLVRKGDSLYLPNQQTFTPIIVPGGVISKIRSGMLEMSNVDISKEFINLITAQRAYQANAKTITTADQILQTTMNIKR